MKSYISKIFQSLVDRFRFWQDRQKIKKLGDIVWFQKNSGKDWYKGQNFGDFLSPIIVAAVLKKFEVKDWRPHKRLAAIGSILHLTKTGDVVWGSGVNGKVAEKDHTFKNLDVRLVRGPITRKFLKKYGVDAPATYGDPALLMPLLFPKLKWHPTPKKIIMIPNLNDLPLLPDIPGHITLVSPLSHYKGVVDEILTSELVLSSSLHGIILAEAFGVPVRFVLPVGGETIDKYQDYYEGTGRKLSKLPDSFLSKPIDKDLGLKMGPPVFEPKTILNSFPKDIYK